MRRSMRPVVLTLLLVFGLIGSAAAIAMTGPDGATSKGDKPTGTTVAHSGLTEYQSELSLTEIVMPPRPCVAWVAEAAANPASTETVKAAAARVGLPTEVNIPAGSEVSGLMCDSRSDGGPSTPDLIFAVTAIDWDARQAWILVSEDPSAATELEGIDWNLTMEELGLPELVATDYGFATVGAEHGEVNLWSTSVDFLHSLGHKR